MTRAEYRCSDLIVFVLGPTSLGDNASDSDENPGHKVNKDFIKFDVQAITPLARFPENQAKRTKCCLKMSRRRFQLRYASNALWLLTTLNSTAGVEQQTPLLWHSTASLTGGKRLMRFLACPGV
jgi:hypothetical protein